MRVYTVGNQSFRFPDKLNDFQMNLYVHLTKWKWENICKEPGKSGGILYDSIIPEDKHHELPMLYSGIKERFRLHHKVFPFKTHKFFNHVASSQAACINLFLPILSNTKAANQFFKEIIPEFSNIATELLDSGFRIEFWDDPQNCLRDHNVTSGTDADIGVAYYDKKGKLNLWLFEHKLTEVGFTECGGYKSRGRKEFHNCQNVGAIFKNFDLCYYHSARKYNYWPITKSHENEFAKQLFNGDSPCPFIGGSYQLWRNYLLACQLEKIGLNGTSLSKVKFSVVYPEGNKSVKSEIEAFTKVINANNRFSHFTTSQLIKVIEGIRVIEVQEWLKWYRKLYCL